MTAAIIIVVWLLAMVLALAFTGGSVASQGTCIGKGC